MVVPTTPLGGRSGIALGARAARVACVLVLVAGTFQRPARAQDAPTVSTETEDAVRALVADAWLIAPEDVVLEWGATSTEVPGPEAAVELVGSGSGGHWVARFTLPAGGLSDRDDVSSVRVRAGHVARVPTVNRPVPRGTVLGAADFTLEETLEWGPPSGADVGDPQGWVVQRALERGDALVAPAVRAPWAVEAGANVDVISSRGAVRLRLRGRAAGSGVLGDAIPVRTDDGKRLRGVIVAPGVVDVSSAGAHTTSGGES